MKRNALLIALALAVVATGGCKHSVDEDVAEKLVKKALEKDQVKPTDVSCPSGEAIQVGGSFDCTALSGNKVELTVHVTQVAHATSELSAEGGGGDYKLEAALDDSAVTRGEVQRAIAGADVHTCPEAQKLDKVGATAVCDVTVGGVKKKATATRTDHGVEVTSH
jgi:hypothetical protein